MSTTTLLIAFMVTVGAAAFGMVVLLRLARGLPGIPAWSRGSVRVDSARLRTYGVAAVVGVLILLVTRWPLAGLAAGVLVVLGPRGARWRRGGASAVGDDRGHRVVDRVAARHRRRRRRA